jgi:hypothetical protein
MMINIQVPTVTRMTDLRWLVFETVVLALMLRSIMWAVGCIRTIDDA